MEVLDRVLTKVFGSKKDRDARRLSPLVERINALEAEMQRKSDSSLRELTSELKNRLAQGESLEMILPEAFAATREAAKRTINMRHFDVQLMGGVALFQGNIAEMATGEGKTLVATLSAYLIGLEGKGVHIVTVNDYLARRDMEWMRPVYEFLGLTVGAIQHDQDPVDKRLAYQADITYGTNNEFGFDYLRSNLATSAEDRPQRGLHYAIVDEVDSILIDEARTPLIISGPAELSPETYYQVNTVIPRLRKEVDFAVNEKDRNVLLTEEGMERAQQFLGLDNMFSEENLDVVHYLDQALRAHFLFQRDVHYVVQDGQVVIVDEFTGRLMPGRRWSDGLHQAVEAKEGVTIERENQTLATITFQNYFRMYKRLSGMTGTADTEANEFREIYNLDVRVIPTNKSNIRIDFKDQVYGSEQEKFEAVVSQIVDCHNKKQPVLVGTISIEKSEVLAELLKSRGHWKKKVQSWTKRILDEIDKSKLKENDKASARETLSQKEGMSLEDAEKWADKAEEARDDRLEYLFTRLSEFIDVHETLMKGLPFNVLNAKYHEREADIVAQAGRPGAVTIATNMAGRGTDIILGGNPEKLIEEEISRLGEDATDEQRQEVQKRIRQECSDGRTTVLEAGGLMIVGSERHESRRIDNQLRGRCARQGDPGVSRFFLSLQDDLMRLFGGERIQRIAERFGMEEGEVIEARLVDKSIRRAQKKVEDKNFEIRKYVIKYDDVMNKQREVIYKLRNDLLEGEDPEEAFQGMQWDVFDSISQSYLNTKVSADDWDLKSYSETLFHQFNLRLETEIPDAPNLEIATENLERDLWERIKSYYEERKGLAPSEEEWKSLMRFIMLTTLDHKWKDHLLTMDHLKDSIGLRGYAGKDPQQEYSREGYELFEEMYSNLEREIVARMFRVEIRRNAEPVNRRMKRAFSGPGRGPVGPGPISTRRRTLPKVGRNDPCPCGSGKKYKKCCMKKEAAA